MDERAAGCDPSGESLAETWKLLQEQRAENEKAGDLYESCLRRRRSAGGGRADASHALRSSGTRRTSAKTAGVSAAQSAYSVRVIRNCGEVSPTGPRGSSARRTKLRVPSSTQNPRIASASALRDHGRETVVKGSVGRTSGMGGKRWAPKVADSGDSFRRSVPPVVHFVTRSCRSCHRRNLRAAVGRTHPQSHSPTCPDR